MTTNAPTVAPTTEAKVEIKATPALISAVKAAITAENKVLEAQKAAESKLWLVADALKKEVTAGKYTDKKQARLAIVDAYAQAGGTPHDSTVSRILSNSGIFQEESKQLQIEAARKEGFGWNKVSTVASGKETLDTLKAQKEQGKEAMKRKPGGSQSQTEKTTPATPAASLIQTEAKSSPVTLLRANLTRILELAIAQGIDGETVQDTFAEVFANLYEENEDEDENENNED